MTELEFKQYIFDSSRLELSSQALLLLLYIKMQNRQRYVFSSESIIKAIRFKDERTMRRYKSELLEKGLIRQERCRYGLKITIPAIDGSDPTKYVGTENSDPTNYVGSKNSDPTNYVGTEMSDPTFCVGTESGTESDPTKYVGTESSDHALYVGTKNSDPTFCADQILHSVQSDPTFCACSDPTFHAPLSINNKETDKETKKGESAKNEDECKSQRSLSLSPPDFKSKYSEYQDISEMDDETQAKMREMMKKFS